MYNFSDVAAAFQLSMALDLEACLIELPPLVTYIIALCKQSLFTGGRFLPCLLRGIPEIKYIIYYITY